MNRVNMKQTSSPREKSNYEANRQIAELIDRRDSLLQFQANGTLTAIGKRQLAQCEKKLTELRSEIE